MVLFDEAFYVAPDYISEKGRRINEKLIGSRGLDILARAKLFLWALSCLVEYVVTFGKTDLTELSFQAQLYA